MEHERRHYVNGSWVEPLQPVLLDVVDPSTEETFTQIAVGGPKDVDRAVAAAKAAFPSFSRTSRKHRLDLLRAILSEYNKRRQDLAEVLAREMGAPVKFALERQTATGTLHLTRMIEVLESYKFEYVEGSTLIAREPIGVVGLITPWNWPINQIVCKVAPGIAAGCTMVLKPSEVAPLNAIIWSEVMHAAGVPAGVYNMVQGEGAVVGGAMSSHPDIDMMSFTGSTRYSRGSGGRDDCETSRARTWRKIREHSIAGCGFPNRGHQGRAWDDGQQRAVVQRADPHVRPRRPA
jgi:aldehyde dehydrogenase (NAD+)